MRKKLITITAVGLGGLACFVGCSKESRDEAIDRLGKASKALNGEVRLDDRQHGTPNIVADQQRKERIRQNTKWTLENQARHPAEYCQAQLDEMSKYAAQLEVQAHKYAVAKSQASRSISDDETQIKSIEEFLTEAKKVYREADAANKWPVTISGFTLAKEKAQEKIVDAAQKLPPLKNSVARHRNMLATIEKRIARVSEEQRNVVRIKERIQATLNDLELKKVIDADQGITDALKAINDSLNSLGADYDDPSVDELAAPTKAATRQAQFDAIMAE